LLQFNDLRARTQTVMLHRPMRPSRLRPPIAAPDALTRSLEALHAALTLHVRRRRDAGASIAQVLPEVRAMVRDAEESEGWRDPSDALMGWVDRLTIEIYAGRL
jgi:hypothetical protein